MLKHRLIFGAVMIAAMLGLFYLDNSLDQIDLRQTAWQGLFLGRPYLPAGLIMFTAFLFVIPLGARELCAIFRAKGILADNLMVSLAGMTGWSAMYLLPSRLDSQRIVAILASIVVGLFFLSLLKFFRKKQTQGAVAVVGVTMFAFIYMGLLPGFFILVRRWHSAWLILAVIAITKSCDIGAYFAGRAIGKHKLIPWLSPGKTVEGLVGGVAASTLVAVGLAALGNHVQSLPEWNAQLIGSFAPGTPQRVFTPDFYPLWAVAGAGGLMAVIGQFGDLVASLFKRDAGFKDSGHSIPGFGGVLDVVDSPLAVAPFAYWLLTVLAKL